MILELRSEFVDAVVGEHEIRDDAVIPIDVADLSSSRSPSAYMQMLADIRNANIPEDDDTITPTQRALHTAITILQAAADRMKAKEFPLGYVTTDDCGGIRIEWWHGKSYCVSLVVSAEHDPWAKTYVYVKRGAGQKGDLFTDSKSHRLAIELQKLNNVRSAGG